MLVVVLVKVALSAACRTSPRTGLDNGPEELGITVDAPREQAHRHAADVRAVEVQADAAPESDEIRLREARIGAPETRDLACSAGFHALSE